MNLAIQIPVAGTTDTQITPALEWNVYRYAFEKWDFVESFRSREEAEAKARNLRAEAIAGRHAARAFYVGNPGQVVNGTTLAAAKLWIDEQESLGV